MNAETLAEVELPDRYGFVIKTVEGKLYLCIVLDLLSKLVTGWLMHHRQDRQVVIRAVEMVIWQRKGGNLSSRL